MADYEDGISRETIFSLHASDADGYYKLIVTVATAFLGGSLLFLEKFVPEPTWWILGYLAAGWLCLVAAIGRVTQVRRANITAARHALEKRFAESSSIGDKSDRRSTQAALLLVVGMCFMVLAGTFTLGGRIMSLKKTTTPQPGTTGERTIHYGSTGPQNGDGSSGSGSGTSGGSGSSGSGQSGSSGGSSSGQSGGTK